MSDARGDGPQPAPGPQPVPGPEPVPALEPAYVPEPFAYPTPPDPSASDPTPPARFRWRGYPGVSLTPVPLGVRGALGIAVLTACLVAAEHAFVASPAVHAAVAKAVSNVAVSAAGKVTLGAVIAAIVGVATYAISLLPAWLVIRDRGVPFREAVGFRRFRVGPAIAAAAATLAVGFWFTTEFVVLLQRLGAHPRGNVSNAIARYHSSPVGVAVLVLLVVIVGPIVEETIFRGVVFASLREAWGETPAIMVSAVLFGAAHLDLVAFVPTAIIGVLLARIYSSSRSLWASILAHAAYNGFVLWLGLTLVGLARK